MALHYDDDTDVNGDDLSGFGLWLAALHDDHDDDDDNDDLYKMVKTTSVLMMLNPENTLLNQCHAPKALFKVPKICNLDFWIEITPPPLERFQKFIRFGSAILPQCKNFVT